MVQDIGTVPTHAVPRVLSTFNRPTALSVMLTMVDTAREFVSNLIVLLTRHFTTPVSTYGVIRSMTYTNMVNFIRGSLLPPSL